MSGPRVTSGAASRQDYSTPSELMGACASRFGPIVFDLAATAENAKHERYYAPSRLMRTVTFGELGLSYLACEPSRGAVAQASRLVAGCLPPGDRLVEIKKPGKGEKLCTKVVIACDNVDPGAYALDALAQPLGAWAELSRKFKSRLPDDDDRGGPGVDWLNCEWADVDPWASRCREEAGLGMNGLLLVPAQVGSLWFDRHVAGHADVFFLQGRVPFNGEPFPKDCMVCHYYPGAGKIMAVWDWRKDRLVKLWGARLGQAKIPGDLGFVYYYPGIGADGRQEQGLQNV